jgi:anaerobic dimethyl sulfoxide reductase subunit B (iron-sulfur subunit)
MRALEFGPLDEMINRYGNLRRLEDMPKDSSTRPAVVFKPAASPKRVVPWDPARVLELWQKRTADPGESFPPVFEKISDVIEVPTDIVGRNRLVLKTKNSKDLMYHTTDDE